MRRRFLLLAWKTKPYIRLLSGMMSSHSMADRGVAEWISSTLDIPALSLEPSSWREMGIDPSRLFLLEMRCSPTEGDGDELPLQCGEMALTFERSEPMVARPSRQQTSTPFIPEAVSGGRQQTSSEETESRKCSHRSGAMSDPSSSGGSLDDTSQMDGECARRASAAKVGSSSVPRMTRPMTSKPSLERRGSTPTPRKSERSSSSTSRESGSTSSLSHSVMGPMGSEFQVSLLNLTQSVRMPFSLDTCQETATERATHEVEVDTGEQPPSARRSFLVLLYLPNAPEAWLRASGGIRASLERASKEERSTSDRSGSSPFLTGIALPWSRAITDGRWCGRLIDLVAEPSTTSPSKRTNPTLQEVLSSTTVSHFQRRVFDEVKKTLDTCGQVFSESSKKSDQLSFFARTSPLICELASTQSSRTWNAWVTTLRQECLLRGVSVRPISENVYSGSVEEEAHFPTPTATPYGTSQNEGENVPHKRPSKGTPSIETAAKIGILPTPQAHDAKSSPGAQARERGGFMSSLSAAVLPTPRNTRGAMCSEASESEGDRNSPGLAYIVANTVLPTPRAAEAEHSGRTKIQEGHQKGLVEVVITTFQEREFLPTPVVSDSFGGRNATDETGWETTEKNGKERHSGTTLSDVAYSTGVGHPSLSSCRNTRGKGGKLNPEFVEWMMDVPIGWTDYRGSATRSFRRWLLEHSLSCSRNSME